MNRWWYTLFAAFVFLMMSCKKSTVVDPPTAFGVGGLLSACAAEGDFTTLCKAIYGSPLKEILITKDTGITLLVVNNTAMAAYFSSVGITEAEFLADNAKITAFVNANTLNGKLPSSSLSSSDEKMHVITSQGGKYIIDQFVVLDSFPFGSQTNSIYYFSTGQFLKP